MKKRKMYTILGLSLLVFFLFSFYMSFSAEKSLITTEYTSTRTSTYQSAQSLENQCSVDEYIEYCGYMNYPSITKVYDKNLNLVGESGSFLKLNRSENYESSAEYIYIDKYLTSSTKKLLTKLEKENTYYEIAQMDYFEQDNQIIPLSIKMMDTNDSDKDLITVALYPIDKVEKGIDIKTHTDYVDYKFIDIDEGSINHKLYEKMQKEQQQLIDEMRAGVHSFYSSGGYYGPESSAGRYNVQLSDGNNYVALKTSQISPVLYTLTSERFWYTVRSQILFILIAGVVLFITVNKFYKKSKAMEESKQAFTSAAAHELKTPLCVIQNQCECIIENVAPQKNSEYISSIYSESLRMNKLVATLLQYNRLALAESIDKNKCSLSSIVNDEVSKYNSFAKSKSINISCDICSEAVVNCNDELIALVIDNFLSNAIKHTIDEGEVKVTLEKIKHNYKLSVYNEGDGIDDKYGNNLWDVFYRSDKSRTRSDHSTGMGLAICKQILELHDYKYGFINTENGVEFYFITD